MKALLNLLLVVILSAFVGGGVGSAVTLSQAPISAPVVAAPATLPQPLSEAPVCLEDMPCFDCATMGNKVCNVTTEATASEAWASYDALAITPSSEEGLTVYYERTLSGTATPATGAEFIVPSATASPNQHVFSVTASAPAVSVISEAPVSHYSAPVAVSASFPALPPMTYAVGSPVCPPTFYSFTSGECIDPASVPTPEPVSAPVSDSETVILPTPTASPTAPATAIAEDGSVVPADFWSDGYVCSWVNGLCTPVLAEQ